MTNIQNPLVQKGGGGQISADRRSVLVQFDVKGDADKAKEKIEPIIDAVVGVQKANPFPTADAFDSSLGGNQDAFATKLNKPSGGLSFSTYLGGSGTDVGVGIALDSASPNPNAYIIGATGSGDFPTTPVAFDGTLAGASTASCATAPCDAFVSKIAQSRRP